MIVITKKKEGEKGISHQESRDVDEWVWNERRGSTNRTKAFIYTLPRNEIK